MTTRRGGDSSFCSELWYRGQCHTQTPVGFPTEAIIEVKAFEKNPQNFSFWGTISCQKENNNKPYPEEGSEESVMSLQSHQVPQSGQTLLSFFLSNIEKHYTQVLGSLAPYGFQFTQGKGSHPHLYRLGNSLLQGSLVCYV